MIDAGQKLGNPIPVIGLVGGIAAGKSEVGRTLERSGGVHIDADRIGHEVLEEADIREQLVRHFGERILSDSGTIDRRALAQVVFQPSLFERDLPQGTQSPTGNLKTLEAIVHPRIRTLVGQQIDDARHRPDPPTLIVLDAPLLIEARWVDLCDYVLFIDSARETRLKRARLRGWSDDEFARRELEQAPLETKRSAASTVINNDGSLEEVQRQVREFVSNLNRRTSGRTGQGT